MGRGRGRGRGRGDRNYAAWHSDDEGPMQTHGGRQGSAAHIGNVGRSDDEAAYGSGLTLEGNKKPRRARVESDDEQDAAEDQGDADAMIRALEDQPDLKIGLEPAQVKKMEAEAAKERGNDAFKAKDFDAAIEHYNSAIQADNTNATFYSNRSAAYAALEKWEEAREDGARAANLRPTWSKAWSRLGAALMGLEDYTEAKEAYSKARELEPDDKAISNAWIKADYEERQASQSGRLAFNKRKLKGAPAPGENSKGSRASGDKDRGPGRGPRKPRRDEPKEWNVSADAEPAQPAPKKKRTMLSFGDDSEEDGE